MLPVRTYMCACMRLEQSLWTNILSFMNTFIIIIILMEENVAGQRQGKHNCGQQAQSTLTYLLGVILGRTGYAVDSSTQQIQGSRIQQGKPAPTKPASK